MPMLTETPEERSMLTQTPEELAMTSGFDVEYSVPFYEQLMNDPLARIGWNPSTQLYADLGSAEEGLQGQTVRGAYGQPQSYGQWGRSAFYSDEHNPAAQLILNEMLTKRPNLARVKGATAIDWNAQPHTAVHEARHVGLGKMLSGMGAGRLDNFLPDAREEAMFRMADLEAEALGNEPFDVMKTTQDSLNYYGAKAFGNPDRMLSQDEKAVLNYEWEMYKQMANEYLQKRGRLY